MSTLRILQPFTDLMSFGETFLQICGRSNQLETFVLNHELESQNRDFEEI